MITGALTWELAKDDKVASARSCWYCGLVLALAAVTMATQQSNFLNRARCHPRKNVFLRKVIGLQVIRGDDGIKLALYLWQTPIMLLNFSILLTIAGIIVLVSKMEQTGGVSRPAIRTTLKASTCHAY